MFTLPDLPYAKNALEPHISENTLNYHYDKHHAGYVAKLNTALEDHPHLLSMSIDSLLLSHETAPKELQAAILNNGGQHYNHSMYWESMSGQGGGDPVGALLEAIEESFGSFDNFKGDFAAAGASQFGSGWAWLSYDNTTGKLVIDKTLNADTPLLKAKTPLMTMDVWEHAYYLDYQNARPQYINNFWEVVNWAGVSEKLNKATA